jgi:divalent metal cation (Fe/Co/Zn/Cd) transporter
MDKTFPKIQKHYKYALFLSIFTIVANLMEGFASTSLGYADETLVLFGFGIDSFIEVISAIGITMMILRLAGSSKDQRTTIENLALRVTAISFYLLTAGLFITVLINLYFRQTPASTRWGVVISIISLTVMFILMKLKLRVGGELNSAPIIADAHCTRACIYMSLILLGSSLLFSITKIASLDSIGAIGIAFYSYKEGHEAWRKASRNIDCDCD